VSLFIADSYGRTVGSHLTTSKPTASWLFKAPDDRPKVAIGDKYGQWAGRELQYLALPGGAMLQFDLSQLTLADFRSMRDHYQINASLYVLTFILHQIDWHIECTNQEIREMIEQNLRDVWTTLIRGLSQAFWAGYSPLVINYENDLKNNYVVIDKFKDLIPEECRVNWKKTPGAGAQGQPAPSLLKYDGIIQTPLGAGLGMIGTEGQPVATRAIPTENSLWYPLMMENGDYYGRKLLKPAFPAWYFSQIIHLFNNRYLERFGEPTPLGRAPFDEEVDMGGGTMASGKVAMESILAGLRNRSVVVLPSDRDPNSGEYDYQVEYLESQMRGADFERYMSRLDEEMSLALFTPILLFRTANVGSYNLGQAHLKIFLWMLNSIAGDLKYYIQNYVVNRLHDINFGPGAPPAVWAYRKLGKDDTNLYTAMLQALVASGRATPDLEELGTAIGLTLREVEQITDDPNDPLGDPESPEVPKDPAQDSPPSVTARYPASLDKAREVLRKAVVRAYNTAARGSEPKQFAYQGRLVEALCESGADTATAQRMARHVYSRAGDLMADLYVALPGEPEKFRDVLGQSTGHLLAEAFG
jgi:hypothetical protein